MAVELIRRGLPKPWSFAVTRDGRIFFINDETRTTTWLHPVTGEPVCTGNVTLPDLPAGWERSVSSDGIQYYIDHNRKETTFMHPGSHLSPAQCEPNKSPSHHAYHNTSSEYTQNSLYSNNGEFRKSQKKKGQNIRSPTVKRNNHSPVIMDGWLYKLDGGALKQWRKRWFVLTDFCLFYYKGPDEEKVLGSILLPSYKINPCTNDDKISRKFAFKAEHHNMKTYYFAADSKESMAQWINVMSMASVMQKNSSSEVSVNSLSPKISLLNDDEDSGFTSYKSRRYGSSQDPNSTLNSSFGSEQLHFQNSSHEYIRDNFSDSSHFTGKLSENEFLGSGDKYPGHYGGSLSRSYSSSPREQDIQMKGRQPLYANAPPKPKRTGQRDPYTIAPNEHYSCPGIDNLEERYDIRNQKHSQKNPQQNRYGVSCPRLYSDQSKYTEHTKEHYPPGCSKLPGDYQKYDETVYNDHYYSKTQFKSPTHQREIRIARPHSADFLEHESYTDPFNAPISYHTKSFAKSKSNQPPRPKSSLERYDPYQYGEEDAWSREDKDYWQREQLSSTLPNHFQGDSSFEEQNASYYSLQDIPTDQQQDYEQYQRNLEIPMVQHQKAASNSRILNGKQSCSRRIRENRPASTGFQIGTSLQSIEGGTEDKKSQLREESLKRLLEWKQRMLQSPLSRKYPQKSSKIQQDKTDGSEIPPTRPPLPEEYHQRVLQELENHEAQLRVQEKQYKESGQSDHGIMVTNAEIHPDRRKQKSISDDNESVNHSVLRSEMETVQRNARSPSRSQEHKRSSSSLGRLNNSYSSDEEEYNTKDHKKTRRSSQINRTRRSSIEKYSGNKNLPIKLSSLQSPDYVNISTLSGTFNLSSAGCDTFATSGKMKSIPAEEDLRTLATSDESLKNDVWSTQMQDVNGYEKQYLNSCDYQEETEIPVTSSKDEIEDDKKDFYIKKEDYYRASQLFYSLSPGNKTDKCPQKTSDTSCNKVLKSHGSNVGENVHLKTDTQASKSPKTQKRVETYDSYYWKNVEKPSCKNWELDKDVGLPLPPYPGSARMKDARQKKMQLRSNSLPIMQQHSTTLEKDHHKLISDSKMDKVQELKSDVSNNSCDNTKLKKEDKLFHHQTSDNKSSESIKSETTEIQSPTKKNCSFEEMRTILQRQREAPPPNIVQNRIKHFEQTAPTQSNGETKKSLAYNEKQKVESPCQNSSSNSEMLIPSDYSNQSCFDSKNLIWKNSSYPRQLCSDSETVLLNDSQNEGSNEDIQTIKSAPIILSPLSSVLVDLRRTADTGRETTKANKTDSCIDEVIITKGALRLSLVEGKDKCEIIDAPIKSEEEAYLPMKGKKNLEEPVYVAMDESKGTAVIEVASNDILKHQYDKQLSDDEPLYNEPISPPPSFLHDVYGKHKPKHGHFSYESDHSSSENIYEKPKYFNDSNEISPSVKKSSVISLGDESNKPFYSRSNQYTNDIYKVASNVSDKKESSFHTALKFSSDRIEKPLSAEELADCDIPSQLNDSIPDLLQMKDSDASDADDEASRDFDTPKNLSLPPYQTAILLGEQSSIDDHMSTDDDHTQISFATTSDLYKHIKTRGLSDNESSNREINIDLAIKTKKKQETLAASFEPSTFHSSCYQVYDEEHRFSEFLHNMIPKEQEYFAEKSDDSKQFNSYPEGKKLKSKPSLSVIQKESPESDIKNSEKLPPELPVTAKYSKPIKTESDLHMLNSSKSVSLEMPNSNDENKLVATVSASEMIKHDCSPNSLATCSSLTPDVVPADDRDEMSAVKKASRRANRVGNSAPYYYSDLLPNIDDLNHLEKYYSSRSNQNMLNNVRDVSPSSSNKGDVGRKVNKICENNSAILPSKVNSLEMPNSQQNSNQHVFPADISQMGTQELRNSLQHLLIPESSKFRDAERNKYEAGHTLEKTRNTSSTLQKLKQRSATPDFNRSQEHYYENLDPMWAATVKRLSRSLEELLDSDDRFQNQDSWHPYDLSPDKTEEPYYENIGFAYHTLTTETDDSIDDAIKDRDVVASPQVTPAKHTIFDNDQLNFSLNRNKDKMFNPPLTKEYVENVKDALTSKTTLPSSAYVEEHDSDLDYLDQNVLRNASKRHFLGRFAKEKYTSQLTKTQYTRDSMNQVSHLDSFLVEGQRSNFDGGGENLELPSRIRENFSSNDVERNLYKYSSRHNSIERSQNIVIGTERPDNFKEQDFFDSSSDSSTHPGNEGPPPLQNLSSCYPANDNLDSSSANIMGVFRTSKEDPNMSDSEIHVRTPSRLQKLVHQSEGLTSSGKRLSISAGDLLGKTHEELVLLLIQLRRNQSRIAKAKQQCRIQLENLQHRAEVESATEEHFKKCEELQHQIVELEKQYEMGQPLVNLVDNMVKLGSLYGPERKTMSNPNLEYIGANISIPCTQLLELSRQLNTRQFTCKDGSESISLGEESFEERLHQLYCSDRILQDEFLTFMSLQQDRDILQTTLDGIKKKVAEFRNNAVDMGRLHKQQRMIEKELSRVNRLLIQNIQKLECIIGENMKLEQDIAILKQKIQQFLQSNSDTESASENVDIEAELLRIQQIIDELSTRRRNISNSIEKMKAESKNKAVLSEVRASPTGVAGSMPLPIRKKHQTSYMETDLDTMETRNLAGSGNQISEIDGSDIPLYANAEEINSPTKECLLEELQSSLQVSSGEDYYPQDISEADDRMKMFYGIIPKDKPSEIKTVRIVKRESERRNRVKDKKKVTYDDNSLVWVVEEPEIFLYEDDDEEEVQQLNKSMLLPALYNRPTSLFSPQHEMAMSAHERLFGNSSSFPNFQESKMISSKSGFSNDFTPTRRNKRRHYTISGFSYNPLYKGGLRSCDDVDMERCLRTANTPDIVRSTIKKSDVFDDKIIDRELGLPQKINIPERYIEDEPEQLSATERLKRSLKAETIRQMLSEMTAYEDLGDKEGESSTEMLKKRVDEEKKRRAHLLALNHALAREVMEKSKIVAVLATLEQLDPANIRFRQQQELEEDLSPVQPLPITQQRENYLT